VIIRTIRYAVLIACLLVAAAASDARADKAVDDLIAQIATQAKTNTQRTLDFHHAAGQVPDNPSLQVPLLAQAVEYGLKSPVTPEVRDTVTKSLDLLVKIAPKRIDTWQERRIEFLTRWFRMTRDRDQRIEAGETLLRSVLNIAAAREKNRRWGEAAGAYRQALSVATTLRLPEKAEITARMRLAVHRSEAVRRVERYVETLKKDPTSTAVRDLLVKTLVLDLDEPDRAVPYVNKDVAETYRTCVPLTATDIDQTPEAACGTLGKWYHDTLYPRALAVNKSAVLRRAEAYYQRFIELHAAKDVASFKAKTALLEIEAELKRLGAASSPRGRDQRAFIADKSMKPFGVGKQFSPFPVQETADGLGPFSGKGVYFDQKTGKDVLYEIRSRRRVKVVGYKGAAIFKTTIEVLDPKGKTVAAIGPLAGGNKWAQFTLKVPATVGHHFFLRFRNHASTWFYINTLTLGQ